VVSLQIVECVIAMRLVAEIFTAEARVQSQVSPCEMFGGQSISGTCFSPGTSFSQLSASLHTCPILMHPSVTRTLPSVADTASAQVHRPISPPAFSCPLSLPSPPLTAPSAITWFSCPRCLPFVLLTKRSFDPAWQMRVRRTDMQMSACSWSLNGTFIDSTGGGGGNLHICFVQIDLHSDVSTVEIIYHRLRLDIDQPSH
jgi:hypothetical protein